MIVLFLSLEIKLGFSKPINSASDDLNCGNDKNKMAQ